jgi:hypothetical protein
VWRPRSAISLVAILIEVGRDSEDLARFIDSVWLVLAFYWTDAGLDVRVSHLASLEATPVRHDSPHAPTRQFRQRGVMYLYLLFDAQNELYLIIID